MSACRTVDDVAPGSPAGIRSLAGRIDATADEAREARQETMGIAQTTGSVAWEGDAADGFVQKRRIEANDENGTVELLEVL